MTNIYADTDLDMQDVMDTVCQAYVDATEDATEETVAALADWVAQRYVSAHILDMAFRGMLTVNVDPITMEPLFTSTPETKAAYDAEVARTSKVTLRIVK